MVVLSSGSRSFRFAPLSFLPVNFVEECLQSPAAGGVQHLDKSNPTSKVCSKIVQALMILGLRPVASTVVKECFQALIFPAPDIGMHVQDNAGELLADPRAHEARFPGVNFIPFLQGDATDVDVE